ncbi:MAG: EamA family transporter [Candidatus Pacebacteria bacterium]|nr:EamA family transporter [Candidatus Paceibacterota bacterium]
MNWFWIALISPIVLALVNHIDKYVLSHRLKGRGVDAIFLFSSILAFGSIPAVFVLSGSVGVFSFSQILFLMISGAVGAFGFLLYLHSVFKEEISLSIAVFQLNPVWSYILGLVFLGEVLTKNQIFASIIIILGVFIITLDFEELKLKRFVMRKSVLLFMGIASVLYAVQDVMFKYVVQEDYFWAGVFWQIIGVVVLGILFYLFKKSSRKELNSFLSNNNAKTFRINAFAEFLYLGANVVNTFSLLLAPVALVSVVGSSQPLFVFLGSLLIARFLPKISSEKLAKGHILHKLVSIGIVIIGSYLLYTA